MFDDGGRLMPDLYSGVAMVGVKNIFDHMAIKDCYEAGLITEDEWKSYLKRLINSIKEDNNGK